MATLILRDTYLILEEEMKSIDKLRTETALKIQEAVNNMDAINGKPNFDILNLTWQDMNNPLYSAILLRLFMALDPNEIPSTLKGQAEWWKSKWNTKEGKGSVSDFIEKNENDKLWK